MFSYIWCSGLVFYESSYLLLVNFSLLLFAAFVSWRFSRAVTLHNKEMYLSLIEDCLIHPAINCASLPLVSNGVVVYSTPGPSLYPFGATARYSCNAGFGLSTMATTLTCGGDGSSTNGVWSGMPPTCDGEKSCRRN